MEDDQNRSEQASEKQKKTSVMELVGKAGKATSDAAQLVGEGYAALAEKTKLLAQKPQQAVLKAVDQNGNGKVDIEDVIIMGLKVPGIRVDRAQFLQKEFQPRLPKEVIDDAIAFNPLHAQIPSDLIKQVADEVIKYERNCVSGIAAMLGMPGGIAMAATIPADIAQYYGYMLRAAQKLMYLYGFPDIAVEEKGQKFDTATMNTLIICLGVMYGVAGANNALKAMAKALATGVEKQLLRRAITKGTVYTITRKVAKWFGVKMTKQLFAGVIKKAIPLVGGVIGGGITFVAFKPCCDKLRATLQDTMLSNPHYCPTKEEDQFVISDEETFVEAETEDGGVTLP